MPGFLRSLQPFLRFGVGLFALALLGGLVQLVSQWVGVPLFVLFVAVGVAGVLVTVLYLACISHERFGKKPLLLA